MRLNVSSTNSRSPFRATESRPNEHIGEPATMPKLRDLFRIVISLAGRPRRLRQQLRMRTFILLVLMAFASCRSVEWQLPPTQDTWRGASVWATKDAVIGARNESSAKEIHELYAELSQALVTLGEAPPSAPLILVVDAGDTPLCGDGPHTLEQLQEWHQAIVHPEQHGNGRSKTRTAPPGAMPGATPELMAKMGAVYAAVVPITAAELALPPTWRSLSSWSIVVPTEAVHEEAVDAMVDFMMSHEDMTLMKRILMAPLMPMVRSKMREGFREMVLRQLVDACCAPSVLGRTIGSETKDRLLQLLGVESEFESVEPLAELDGQDG